MHHTGIMIASLFQRNPNEPKINLPDQTDWIDLKHQNRIDEIDCRTRAISLIKLKTTYASQILRKDWNIVTAKMFILCIQRKDEDIKRDLDELKWQAQNLAEGNDLALFKNIDTDWLNKLDFKLTIIHPTGAAWLRHILSIDNSVAILYAAQRIGLIDRYHRQRILTGVSMANGALKQSATKIRPSFSYKTVENT